MAVAVEVSVHASHGVEEMEGDETGRGKINQVNWGEIAWLSYPHNLAGGAMGRYLGT